LGSFKEDHPLNDHKLGCRCKECYCKKHKFSLRRPTKPPHGWQYPECPLCKKKVEDGDLSDFAVPC
jgi:hypothetical protein